MRGVISLAVTFLLLVAGAVVYHYDLTAAAEIVMLVATTLMTGLGAVSMIGYARFSRAEATVLAAALGFAITAFLQWTAVSMGWPGGTAIVLAIAFALISLLATRSWSWANGQLRYFTYALPLATLIALFFNLACLHYGVDGSIVSRGLFSHDMPFLAGEIHGLRYSPHLVDLHQAAMPWSYHDATYHVLALSSTANTLDVLVWCMPIFGYAVLAIGVYAVVDRWLKNRVAAVMAVVMWFASSPFWGSELTSYALSPSFVVGSIIALALIVAVLEFLRSRRTVIGLLVLALLIELARFKISTFLVIGPAIGILALLLLRRDWKAAIVLGGSALVAALQLVLFSMPASALMPANDFVVGAPLLGYANHVAALLHWPIDRINPVTHGGIGVRSLLLLPYVIFHVARLVVLDPRVLLAVVLGVLVVRRRQTLSADRRMVALLLLIAIPIGYMLPVLYSPSWYALALSFYAPLVSAQAAVLLMAIGFDRIFCARTRVVRIAVPLVAVVSIAFGLRSAYLAVTATPFVVSSELRTVLTELAEDREDHGVLATRRFDLDPTDTVNDESFYWYAALGGHPVISEGAKYGALLGAVAETDSNKGLHPVRAAQELLSMNRSRLAAIYYSGDPSVVSGQIGLNRVRFVLERQAQGTPDEALHVDLSHMGKVAFRAGNTRIWEISAAEIPLGTGRP